MIDTRSGKETYSVERVRKGHFVKGIALVRGVQSLDGQDRASSGEILVTGDQRSTTEVGTGAHTLEDRRKSNKSSTVDGVSLTTGLISSPKTYTSS